MALFSSHPCAPRGVIYTEASSPPPGWGRGPRGARASGPWVTSAPGGCPQGTQEPAITRPSVIRCLPCRAHSYLDIIEQAISEGDTLLIENIGETVDPVLDPLLGRNTIKKGK